MFDPRLNSILRPVLKQVAQLLVKAGVSANQITVVGFLIGMLALPLLAFEAYLWALAMIAINRIADGLDGAVARLTHTTDAGGYLDITFDFIFYSSVVFGFLLANPEQNAIAAGLLLVTFMGTGSTFLAFSTLAVKHGIDNPEYPNKSLHYMGGITEGFETILAFVLFCLWPQYFVALALVFSALCWITACSRLWAGYQTLKHRA
ncbi:Phosphatidylglycerophosphate synthase [Pseudidiomarina planktonica]|uniref:Phosphatidylglycerophosphate synthase n=1 Tax=Pseudidiomarina planktonica TaxID=1323738 RepID=A0A1Y6FYG8_9GAMM|nr:CDP-alcohol phosphatidyltransferase family protein [Pseudidiomarina planktonica]RUO63286.1 CDP-alcohol phosphatidyltransferase family protein [Pseudidiomarina planktonica]SMQ80498.1 Phosphatidylglycerophosphate synthase [Pseudidiomarina planktonica]